jgi:hypothetical protein
LRRVGRHRRCITCDRAGANARYARKAGK